MLKSRKGFVRVAVEEGIDGGLVPVYHFGNTAILDFAPQASLSVHHTSELPVRCQRSCVVCDRGLEHTVVLGQQAEYQQQV